MKHGKINFRKLYQKLGWGEMPNAIIVCRKDEMETIVWIDLWLFILCFQKLHYKKQSN